MAANRALEEAQIFVQNKGGNDVRPVPDPTVLTTQQLQTAIAALREVFDTRLDGMDKAILVLQEAANRSPTIGEISVKHEEKFNNFDQRFHDRDVAVKLLQTQMDGFNEYVEDAVGRLKDLHDEKFKSIATQFTERDTRAEQTSRDSKVAVDAALQAAKEAVGEQNKSSGLAISKSEAATTKQIDQIGTIIQTMEKSLNDKVNDMKDRMTAIESIKQGIVESKQTTAQQSSNISGYIVAICAFCGLGIATLAMVAAFMLVYHK